MMKHKLLATTALVSLFAGSAFADGAPAPMMNDMSVKIGGMFDAHAVTANRDDTRHSMTKNHNDVGFSTNGQVYIEAKSSTSKGLEYGAHLGISTHATGYKNPAQGMDRSYLWLEHNDLGLVQFGSNNDTSESFRTGADSLAVATGGISGAFIETMSSQMFTTAQSSYNSLHEFVMGPWSIGDNQIDLDMNVQGTAVASGGTLSLEKARKVNYVTPKMNGFQLGLSFTPDVENKGTGLNGVSAEATMPNTVTKGNTTGIAAGKNVVSGGISWDGKIMDDIMSRFSVVGMYGEAALNQGDTATNDIEGFDIGASFEYKGIKTAFSYGSLGKTGFQTSAASGVSDTQYVTAGVAYDFDKLATSLTGLYGVKNSNVSTILSLGGEYDLATGIRPYAEATYYNLDLRNEGGLALSTTGGTASSSTGTTTARANPRARSEGTVFIIGTKLKF